ncbi:FG-nucleoporin nsp1 [Coemansia spiralis]|uniref:FG-nucleoporin nsp1 n=2 Tax=Coemansia TaxID=4863 RepID=A0A9W8KWT9_9FUNG|nr:FG-nucleoporin nsp1 [Coemansia umbellata]KAJ2624409.1 FG-nucleoporin nsp1 [Coemansia sp. RSA 1358]KAJ2674774.1 FG-nucleoporin nsp1 [Coemansia spiralis]
MFGGTGNSNTNKNSGSGGGGAFSLGLGGNSATNAASGNKPSTSFGGFGGSSGTSGFGGSGGTGGFGGFGVSGSGAGSSIFGTNNNKTASGTKPATTQFPSFGAPSVSGGSAGGGSLFEAGASKPEASKPTTPFAFGTSAPPTSNNSGGNSMFGSGANTPAFGTGASGGSLFGTSKPATTAATSVAPTSSTFSAAPAFGGSGASASGFSLGGTASSATSAPATAPAPAPAPAATTSATSTSLFGTSAAPSSGGLSFSGFGTKPAAGAESKPAPFSLAGASSSSSSNNTIAAATSAPAPPTGITGSTNPTSGAGFGSFKLASAPTVSDPAGNTSADKSTNPLGKASEPASTSQPAGSDTAESASKNDNSADLANAALRGKTLEEIAQMWTAELAAQTRAFHTQANTVSYWDRALVQQGKRITELYEATMAVEAEQAALDQSLEHMEGQQAALQNLLDAYEGRVQDIVRKTTTRPSNAKGVAMTADEERDHVYSSAERLNMQLDELARRLTTLVEDVNGVSNASTSAASGPNDGDGQRGAADPFAQIVQILNGHLTSLEWVDSQTTQLQERVKVAQRVYQDVQSSQTSLTGAYGSGTDLLGGDFSAAQRSNSAMMPTIPGGFVNDPVPPVTSSFGTPMGTARKPVSNPKAPQSPFGSTSLRRGF